MKKCYAAERNKVPILEVLKPRLQILYEVSNTPLNVLEIASGTGEHAELFSALATIGKYQPTEPDQGMHESILAYTTVGNALRPIDLDVIRDADQIDNKIPVGFLNRKTDCLICINMIHISPIEATQCLFKIANKILSQDGFLLTYGPYCVGKVF